MKVSILNANRNILVTVLNGRRCNVLCKTKEDIQLRMKSFESFLKKYNVKYKVEDNKITIGEGYVVFTVI